MSIAESNNVASGLPRQTQRMDKARAVMRAQSLDALLVSNPENRRYLTGFTGHDSGADSAGTALVTLDAVALITDGRYSEQAERECPGLRLILRAGEFAAIAAEAIIETGARRIGFEATHMTVALRDDLAAAIAEKSGDKPAPELVATRTIIEPLRAVKDADELAAIERAVAITDETFAYLCGWLRAGLTEKQVAQEIERHMLELGADGLAFDSIVASGPNSALPHAVPSDRPIQLGEPITLDIGSRYAGYCSDMTRTVCLGEPGEQARALYDLVLRAHETCEAGLRAGMNGQQADALARDVIAAAGRGEQFTHGTGHGVGLEIHESPRLSRFAPADQAFEPGMVITIEPGVYIAGQSGVRIEDTAVVTEDGIRVLTASHKRFELPAR
ncbi:MAG TPA: Xaa-Pro peptidase family protein [Ktedonobacterales bacterium]|nr:Xaa-Pro peptidase family protein [Ktedonobacterales bacterium]